MDNLESLLLSGILYDTENRIGSPIGSLNEKVQDEVHTVFQCQIENCKNFNCQIEAYCSVAAGFFWSGVCLETQRSVSLINLLHVCAVALFITQVLPPRPDSVSMVQWHFLLIWASRMLNRDAIFFLATEQYWVPMHDSVKHGTERITSVELHHVVFPAPSSLHGLSQ